MASLTLSPGATTANPNALRSLRDLKKIGFIVPSSNTALEPLTVAMGSQLANQVSFHFSRLQVTTIGTDPQSTNQFGTAKMLPAARLLQDAEVDAMLWNGTSGGWNGGDEQAEMALARELERATGVPASTATLAQVEALRCARLQKIAIVCPYREGPANALVAFYSALGFDVVSTARMDETDNVAYANTPLDRIRGLLRAGDSPRAEAVIVPCTNWPAALVLEDMERELGKPIHDSVCVTLWKALRLVGLDGRIQGWGRLMSGLDG